ncbi:phosphoribosylanthranilate isomerase [Bacillus mesophilum]|uniref:Phosphoribosylanthranilate isomerase n=1 Tax=Bacillus mesophilum TaxID=1071718 RepID=A0A7V7RQG3_9BACI|nr:phosphoribosylanthranilate isomerase [Bacillus mesophilum]KAB2335673.1 phosphoribosylanthranilate isomerase [Bacillus mesophilum]
MKNQKIDEFIQITKKLNDIGTIPLLMGSVGLELVTEKSWNAEDLDIHVPGDSRGWEVPPEHSIFKWEKIVKIMESSGYTLIDLHEHEFSKNGQSIEFGIIDTLPNFAGIALNTLEVQQANGVKYYLLNPHQYLQVYESSSKDSYRAEQNNHKDIEKIKYLKSILHSDKNSSD